MVKSTVCKGLSETMSQRNSHLRWRVMKLWWSSTADGGHGLSVEVMMAVWMAFEMALVLTFGCGLVSMHRDSFQLYCVCCG